MAETQKSTVTPQNVKYLENYDVRIGDLNGFGLRAPPRAQIRSDLRCEHHSFRNMKVRFSKVGFRLVRPNVTL